MLTVKAPSRDVVLTLLSRAHDAPPLPACDLPAHLPILQTPPLADCQRYDALLVGGGYAAR